MFYIGIAGGGAMGHLYLPNPYCYALDVFEFWPFLINLKFKCLLGPNVPQNQISGYTTNALPFSILTGPHVQ